MEDQDFPRVHIRPAVLGDAERVAELADQLGYPSTAEEVCQRLQEILEEKEQTLLVAELPDEYVVGWVGVRVVRTVVQDPLAEVVGLVVDQDHRGKGIGQLLLAQVEQWAREREYAAIYLRANAVRERAHTFYRRHGFVQLKTQLVFRKVL